jgi:sulfite exporter TauE/SafE
VNLAFISSMFAVGLVTSIHCVFMCGGLVLTYAVKGTETGPWYRRLVPHLAYQGSKVFSYAAVALILGGLVALAGSAVDISPIRNWLQVVAGVYMVLLGIGMTGKVKALRYITPRPPKFLVDALSRNRKKAVHEAEEGHTSLLTPIMFGLLTGLMPCAPLIAAQTSAVSQTGGLLTGVLGMVGFGFGTMPLMLVFGFASSLLSRQFQAKMQVVAALAVMIFGLVILNRGLLLVGSPVTFDSVRTAVAGTGVAPSSSTAQYTKGADGVVEVPLSIVNTQYVPSTVQIPADVPVRLIVDRKEDAACSNQLVITAAKLKVDLAPNAVTKVDLPALPAGSYQMTCGMGMMSGTLLVGASGVAGTGGSPLIIPGLLIALIGGGYGAYLMRSRKLAAANAASVHAAAAGKSKKGSKSAGPTHAAGATKSAGGSRKTAQTAPAVPKSVGPKLLGFEPAELVLGGSVVILAIIIGLASGGFFR